MERELLEHNFRLLEEQLRKAGFGEEVLPNLKDEILYGQQKAFYLDYSTKVDDEPVKGEFYFEKSPSTEAYEWRKFSLDLFKETTALIRGNIFQVGHGYDTTLREAYNLMHGRYVYKEPEFDRERRGYWASLDIGTQDSDYVKLDYFLNPFRVEKGITDSGLATYLNPEQQKELAESLKQGNLEELTLEIQGVKQTVWAVASPAFEKVLLNKTNGRPLELSATLIKKMERTNGIKR